jgi:hypothetical protein
VAVTFYSPEEPGDNVLAENQIGWTFPGGLKHTSMDNSPEVQKTIVTELTNRVER